MFTDDTVASLEVQSTNSTVGWLEHAHGVLPPASCPCTMQEINTSGAERANAGTTARPGREPDLVGQCATEEQPADVELIDVAQRGSIDVLNFHKVGDEHGTPLALRPERLDGGRPAASASRARANLTAWDRASTGMGGFHAWPGAHVRTHAHVRRQPRPLCAARRQPPSPRRQRPVQAGLPIPRARPRATARAPAGRPA
eukprot:scaffold7462_cov430-Prasinococcus_capsulatus_cf.AAC.2